MNINTKRSTSAPARASAPEGEKNSNKLANVGKMIKELKNNLLDRIGPKKPDAQGEVAPPQGITRTASSEVAEYRAAIGVSKQDPGMDRVELAIWDKYREPEKQSSENKNAPFLHRGPYDKDSGIAHESDEFNESSSLTNMFPLRFDDPILRDAEPGSATITNESDAKQLSPVTGTSDESLQLGGDREKSLPDISLFDDGKTASTPKMSGMPNPFKKKHFG